MIKFYNLWVLFTLSVFYFGPIGWKHQSSFMIGAVVLSCLIFFNFGNLFGKRLPSLSSCQFNNLTKPVAKWTVILGFILLTQIHIYSLTGYSIFTPGNYALDFGEVYRNFQETLQFRNVSTGSLAGLILILKAVMMPVVMILFVLSFRTDKLAMILLIFPFIASGMMRGTDKEGVDIAIYLLVLAFYHKVLGRNALIFTAMVGLILMLFLERKLARYGTGLGACLPSFEHACFHFDNIISVYISPSVEMLRIMVVNYITQGYEGLGYALKIPFEFNYGFGHIAPVKEQICRIFDALCNIRSFNDKLPDYGWDTRHHWSSSYSALANDFHWLFLPVYFFCIGVLFGVSEKSWFTTRDPVSLTVLLLITVFFVYSSAGMQLTVSMEWSMVYLTIFSIQFFRIFKFSWKYSQNLHPSLKT